MTDTKDGYNAGAKYANTIRDHLIELQAKISPEFFDGYRTALEGFLECTLNDFGPISDEAFELVGSGIEDDEDDNNVCWDSEGNMYEVKKIATS